MISTNSVLSQALASLPPGWSASAVSSSSLPAHFDLRSPAGRTERFVVQERGRFHPSDLPIVVDGFTAFQRLVPRSQPILVAPYIGPRARALLRERQIAYADATGALWIATSQVYIERPGADRAPVDEKRRRRSLRGPITGRVVRALCESRGSIGVRLLAERAHTDAGSVSRILDLLEAEGLVTRAQGAVVDVSWQDVIRRWARDLGKERWYLTLIAPHGIERVASQLERKGIQYAVTGAYASAALAPAAHPTMLDVYVSQPQEAVSVIGFENAEHGNVRVIRPFDPIVFERGVVVQMTQLANPIQIAADLLSFPQRSPDEANALFRWMEQHDLAWRVG
jgi:hypothetical protein